MTSQLTYARACLDPNLFGPWFSAESWATWRVIDKAIFAEPLSEAERLVFAELTGRSEPVSEPANECWVIAGRRAGKDLKAASLVTYLATIGADRHGWRKHLVPGETGVVQLLAIDRDQAAICFNYARAFFQQPMLAKLIRRETADAIELTNGFEIVIATNDQRRVRGRTVCAAVFDEVAHWKSETSTTPDWEIYRAVRPAMLTIPNSLMIGISSPHMQRGLLYDKFAAHYGKPGKVLVVRAPTWVLNPTVSRTEGEIADGYASDPQWAAAEYGSEWRHDLASFITRQALDAVTGRVRERAPQQHLSYVAFADFSSGINDSAALGIGHLEGKTAIVDLLREIPAPHSPGQAVEEFCKILSRYGIWTLHADKYALGFVRELVSQHHVGFEECEKSKSEIYMDFLTMVNTQAVELIANERCERQLLALERRAHRGTRDSVDHPALAHDDLANCCAGVCVLAQQRGSVMPAHLLQTEAIGASYDGMASREENLVALAREEARAGGYWSGDGRSPVWHGAPGDGQQAFALDD